MSEEEYEKYKVPLNFKCIISPESNDIKLETLVESFIKRVENQTGYKFCWRAAVHNDTAHRHAHVVINGKDKNGEDVFFNKDTIQLMRLMCSNAATQMIGERTKEQIEAARKNLVKAKLRMKPGMMQLLSILVKREFMFQSGNCIKMILLGKMLL